MLFNSAITVLSFANKVVKVQPRKFVRSCTDYQGRYNIFSNEVCFKSKITTASILKNMRPLNMKLGGNVYEVSLNTIFFA